MTLLAWAALAYHLASRLAYVGWVGWALRAEERAPTRDFARFRRRAATLMNNDGASLVVLCFLSRDTLPMSLPPLALFVVGSLLIVGSVGVKLWAARILGWDAYYWRNFFEPAFGNEPAASGPYRFLRNPMYTVGNLHLYGLALATESLPGLAMAAVDHTAILLFYWIVERPHFQRVIAQRP